VCHDPDMRKRFDPAKHPRDTRGRFAGLSAAQVRKAAAKGRGPSLTSKHQPRKTRRSYRRIGAQMGIPRARQIPGLGRVLVHPNPGNIVGQPKPKGRGWKFKLGVGWYKPA